MEALEFLKEAKRMCETIDLCSECPANACGCQDSFVYWDYEKMIEVVEQWSKEHSVITNRDKLREIISDTFCIPLDDIPIDVTRCCSLLKVENCEDMICMECKYYNFWEQEYKPLPQQ